ncbi:mgtC family protein [Escherichia coli]|uniref:MgtC family protein n=1 Tax=Escherichia coli TaxID=562 RepID=A0A376MHS5_ECOLX|nr:mgtC family protein [Escherichia coli]
MNTLSFLLFSEEESLFITLGKICVAFILGGIIGLERESKGKPVGFKNVRHYFSRQLCSDNCIDSVCRILR